MKKICIVSTVELPLVFFMIPHLRMLQQQYELTVIVNTSNPDFLKTYGISAKVIPVGIERKISVARDIAALLKLICLFRSNRFDLVHSIAPKAGLLAMLAAFIVGIPERLHIFTGQVWVTSSGPRRSLLKSIDRLIALCATHLLADSHSQMELLIQVGIPGNTDIQVLANGSVSGVDTAKFCPNEFFRQEIRACYGIRLNAVLFLFLGRLTGDKGILDLAKAFRMLADEGLDNIALLIAGPDEEEMQQMVTEVIGPAAQWVRFAGYTKTPENFMAAADVLCLPSYREGFGMVTLEAAATGIPSIASRIYGITDAVVDGKTGLLHEPGDINGIAACMKRLADDQELREAFGLQARKRAERDFSQAVVVVAMQDFYEEILSNRRTGDHR